jgi:carbamoyl-phosphate synthase large subunit
VKVLGTPVRAIMDTEDRELFVNKLAEIGVLHPEVSLWARLTDSVVAAGKLGFPVIIRAAYTLGGQGSGFASNDDELRALCQQSILIHHPDSCGGVAQGMERG